MFTHTEADGQPSEVEVKWWKRINCFTEGVYTTGWFISRFLSEKIFSTWTWRIANKTRRQILPKHLAQNKKFGKEGRSRGITRKCAPHERILCAPKFEEERSNEEVLRREGCARREAWDLANIIYKLKNSADEQKKNRAQVTWILLESPQPPLWYWLPTAECTPTRKHKCSFTIQICSGQCN